MANIELRVRGQRLLVNHGYVVAGTVRYITIKAALSEDWQGREVWAYLEYGDKKYKTQLNANGESTARAGLNLSAGEWSIYLAGYGKDADGNETCITSNRVTLNVHPTGDANDSHSPTITPTAEEQLRADIGDLADLTTTDKSSLVAAINETAKNSVVWDDLGAGLKVEDGKLAVDTMDKIEQNNTKPVTSAAVHTEIGNINVLLATI